VFAVDVSQAGEQVGGTQCSEGDIVTAMAVSSSTSNARLGIPGPLSNLNFIGTSSYVGIIIVN